MSDLTLEFNHRKAIVKGYSVVLQRTTAKRRGIKWSLPLVAHNAMQLAAEWVVNGKLPEINTKDV